MGKFYNPMFLTSDRCKMPITRKTVTVTSTEVAKLIKTCTHFMKKSINTVKLSTRKHKQITTKNSYMRQCHTLYIRGGSISPWPISILYRYCWPKILAISISFTTAFFGSAHIFDYRQQSWRRRREIQAQVNCLYAIFQHTTYYY